jgi:hypothetical protein
VLLSQTAELREFPPDWSFVAAGVNKAGDAITDVAYFPARDSEAAEYCRPSARLRCGRGDDRTSGLSPWHRPTPERTAGIRADHAPPVITVRTALLITTSAQPAPAVTNGP